jgi:hypothetical protein
MNIRVVTWVALVASISLAGACSSEKEEAPRHDGEDASGGTGVDAGDEMADTGDSEDTADSGEAGDAGEAEAQVFPPTCTGACDNVASASCTVSQALTDCIAECDLQAAEPTCVTQSAALTACRAGASVSCNADGTPEISGCDAQERDSLVCFACLPAASDDACTTCVKTSCCDQQQAVLADPNLFDYAACNGACNADVTCEQACDAQYPTAAAAITALQDCTTTTCGC